jgi:hypothetical protein
MIEEFQPLDFSTGRRTAPLRIRCFPTPEENDCHKNLWDLPMPLWDGR